MTILTIVLTFFWGVGSLFLVAIKTNSVKTILLRKPSILIGDFFILPIVAGIIANYYQQNNISYLFAGFQSWLVLTIAIILTIISAAKSQLLHPLWIPHLLFYAFMAFIILSFLSNFQLTTFSWWLVFVGIITHQLLGILFPKKFPKIENEKI